MTDAPDLDAMVEEWEREAYPSAPDDLGYRAVFPEDVRKLAAKVALAELTSMLDRVGRLDAEVHDALDDRIAQLRRMAGE
ncbi:MAG: hypothetical protein V3S43_06510 [Acidimicrobiia bacterium]